ncbi:hypothetical protein BDR07DRAFT_1422880 [Suillus spraguei]|nr:hypothetical protein BDR07DRAFT_1422880 [Suillus spraguei]
MIFPNVLCSYSRCSNLVSCFSDCRFMSEPQTHIWGVDQLFTPLDLTLSLFLGKIIHARILGIDMIIINSESIARESIDKCSTILGTPRHSHQ